MIPDSTILKPYIHFTMGSCLILLFRIINDTGPTGIFIRKAQIYPTFNIVRCFIPSHGNNISSNIDFMGNIGIVIFYINIDSSTVSCQRIEGFFRRFRRINGNITTIQIYIISLIGITGFIIRI